MKSFTEVRSKWVNALRRFPLPLLWAFFGSLFCILMIQADETRFWRLYQREVLTLSLGVSWLIATRFFIEQFPIPRKWWPLNLMVLTFLLIFYLSLPEEDPENQSVSLLRWFLYLLAGHVFLFFAPFVTSWNSNAFWNYLKDILSALSKSLLFSGVLYLGLVFALLAIDALFEIKIQGKVYAQLFIFCLGIVNTAVYLYDFPRNQQHHDLIQYNKPIELFIKFILLPLLALYLLILYVYSAKILLEWELPQGWVSNLISILAILGFVIHIIIEPVRRKHPSLLLRKFFPWFYFLLLPLMILLFVAVFRRIADYNFTESRYLLLLLAFWILGNLFYLLFSRSKQLRVLPISLFLLIILSAMGPWGAFQVSVRAQLSELQELYAEVKLPEKQLSHDKAQRFTNIMAYLSRRDKVHLTESFLGFDPTAAFPSAPDYNLGSKVLDSLDIEILESDSPDFFRPQHYYRNFNEPMVVQLENYDLFVELQLRNVREQQYPQSYELWEKEGELRILKKGKLLIKLDLEKELRELMKKHGDIALAEPSEMEFKLRNEHGDFLLIILNLALYMEEERPQLNDLRLYLFHRENTK